MTLYNYKKNISVTTDENKKIIITNRAILGNIIYNLFDAYEYQLKHGLISVSQDTKELFEALRDLNNDSEDRPIKIVEIKGDENGRK